PTRRSSDLAVVRVPAGYTDLLLEAPDDRIRIGHLGARGRGHPKEEQRNGGAANNAVHIGILRSGDALTRAPARRSEDNTETPVAARRTLRGKASRVPHRREGTGSYLRLNGLRGRPRACAGAAHRPLRDRRRRVTGRTPRAWGALR